MQRKPSIADKTDGLLLIEFAKIVQDTVKPTSTMKAIQTWSGIVVLVSKYHKIPLTIFQLRTFSWKSQFECKKSLKKTQTFLGCLNNGLGCEQKVRISAAKINT